MVFSVELRPKVFQVYAERADAARSEAACRSAEEISEVRISPALVVAAVMVLTAAGGHPAVALDARALEAWCLPADPCYGEPKKIADGAFATCEASCSLTDRVDIRGMDAALFDVVCATYGAGPDTVRMLVSRTGAGTPDERIFAITGEPLPGDAFGDGYQGTTTPVELVRCR